MWYVEREVRERIEGLSAIVGREIEIRMAHGALSEGDIGELIAQAVVEVLENVDEQRD